MMAVFCKDCIGKVMGITPKDKEYKAWLVEEGGICEGCGYEYLDKKLKERGHES